MATYSSVRAWRIPRAEEPGGLQSIAWQSQTRLKQLSMHTCAAPHHHRNTDAESGWTAHPQESSSSPILLFQFQTIK